MSRRYLPQPRREPSTATQDWLIVTFLSVAVVCLVAACGVAWGWAGGLTAMGVLAAVLGFMVAAGGGP